MMKDIGTRRVLFARANAVMINSGNFFVTRELKTFQEQESEGFQKCF
jgi:hypothetical protein